MQLLFLFLHAFFSPRKKYHYIIFLNIPYRFGKSMMMEK
ncbi:hypothetical protein B4072_3163 [Bacillus subtilis]|nr:hypothetical protein B4069_3148 [Bacillus subtilis]KIN38936.1 hypothetical protein B4072_3163 [Bacillus subtilis]